MDDKKDVGRTNLIILCFGIFACVALSLMMKHVVEVKDREAVHPIVFDLHDLFGDQLARRPILELEERAARRVCVLTIAPKDMGACAKLARTLGRYVVRFRDRDLAFDAMEIVARTDPGESGRIFTVTVPRRTIDVIEPRSDNGPKTKRRTPLTPKARTPRATAGSQAGGEARPPASKK